MPGERRWIVVLEAIMYGQQCWCVIVVKIFV